LSNEIVSLSDVFSNGELLTDGMTKCRTDRETAEGKVQRYHSDPGTLHVNGGR